MDELLARGIATDHELGGHAHARHDLGRLGVRQVEGDLLAVGWHPLGLRGDVDPALGLKSSAIPGAQDLPGDEVGARLLLDLDGVDLRRGDGQQERGRQTGVPHRVEAPHRAHAGHDLGDAL